MITTNIKKQYHPLIQDNIIVVKHLNNDRFVPKDKYEYSEAAETVIANLIGKAFNLKAENLTTGFDPRYDFKLRSNATNKSRTVELKITRYDDLSIEYAYGEDGSPSGISSSTADLTIYLSGGWTGQGSRVQHVGKLRMFKTRQLKEIVETLKTMSEHCKDYSGNGEGRSSRCVILKKELLKTYNIDIGLMDIGIVKEYGKIIGYDLNNLNPCGDFRYAQSRVWKYFN